MKNSILKNISKRTLTQLIKIRSYFKKFHSLNELDKKLASLLQHKNGFYVEIGANDGISQSNSLYFERKKNWSGVLVEPDAQNYKTLVKNRKKSNKFFNYACVSFDFTEDYIDFIYSNLMSTTIHDKSDIKKIISTQSGINFLAKDEFIKTYLVPAMQLETLLEKANAPFLIDFFSLDVEGNELEVLKGLSHSKYRFKYILIETNELLKISSYLKSVNYQLRDKLSHHDYLFENVN